MKKPDVMIELKTIEEYATEARKLLFKKISENEKLTNDERFFAEVLTSALMLDASITNLLECKNEEINNLDEIINDTILKRFHLKYCIENVDDKEKH